jgi:hypothetical protein
MMPKVAKPCKKSKLIACRPSHPGFLALPVSTL